MRIKTLTNGATPRRSWSADMEIDLPRDEALQLIAAGCALALEQRDEIETAVENREVETATRRRKK